MSALARLGTVVRSLFGSLSEKPPAHFPIDWFQQGLDLPRARSCATVEACVSAYAQTVAQLPGLHFRVRPDGGRDLRPDSALSSVLRAPNGYQTRSDFMLNLVRALQFHGNAYALASRDDRSEIAELHLLDPRGVTPMIYPEDGEIFYRIALSPILQAYGAPLIVPERDILHVKLHTSASDPLRGETPIRAAAAAIAANEAISGHQAVFYDNMSRPSGVLQTDQKLTAEQTRELRDRWEEMSRGLNSGRVPILSSGLTWRQMGLSADDAQMVQAFRMSVEDIARAFRVPLPLVNILEGATYTNTEHLMRFWLASGLGFLLEHIELAFDRLFGLAPGEYLEFDTDRLLRTDFAARMTALGEAVSKGVYAPNEARLKEDLPAVPGGDVPRVQQQMVPILPTSPAPEAPPPEKPGEKGCGAPDDEQNPTGDQALSNTDFPPNSPAKIWMIDIVAEELGAALRTVRETVAEHSAQNESRAAGLAEQIAEVKIQIAELSGALDEIRRHEDARGAEKPRAASFSLLGRRE